MARLACNAPRSRIVHADDGDHGANATRRDHGISEGDIAGVGIVRPYSDGRPANAEIEQAKRRPAIRNRLVAECHGRRPWRARRLLRAAMTLQQYRKSTRLNYSHK